MGRKKVTEKKPFSKRKKNQIVYAYTTPKGAEILLTGAKKFHLSKSDFLTGLLVSYSKGKVFKPKMKVVEATVEKKSE